MYEKREKLVKRTKRLGRGYGSGVGHNCGRGQKGQSARADIAQDLAGGNVPLHRKIPKYKGKGNAPIHTTVEVRIDWLEKHINADETVDLPKLKSLGIKISQLDRVKIIGNVELKKKFNVKGLALTKGAKASLERVGGKVIY